MSAAHDPDYPVMHLCIQCMKRPAAPHNGGLCSVCCPPLKPGKLLRAMRRRRVRFYAELRTRQMAQAGQRPGAGCTLGDAAICPGCHRG